MTSGDCHFFQSYNVLYSALNLQLRSVFIYNLCCVTVYPKYLIIKQLKLTSQHVKVTL